MSSIKTVAIAGASGSLGSPMTKALLDANFTVTSITRPDSHSTFPAGVKVTKVDYNSIADLTRALAGQDAVISTINAEASDLQTNFIEAAVAAKVQRIIPSEFGSDTVNPKAAALPVYGNKVETQKLLHEKCAGTDTTYTLVFNNAFLDWGISKRFLIDAQDKKMQVVDGGDLPWTATPLDFIAKGVAAVLQHPDETANKVVRLHGVTMTQNKLLEILKRVVGNEGWTVSEVKSEDLLKKSYENLQKDPGNAFGWALGMLTAAVCAEGYGGDFSGNNDNAMLGLKELSEKEVEDLVRSLVCSTRALEQFVRDLSGFSIQRPQPLLRTPVGQHRRFGARPGLRQLETVKAANAEDGFVPFDFERSKVAEPNKRNENRNGLTDADWHAELEIAQPQPQDTNGDIVAQAEAATEEIAASDAVAAEGPRTEVQQDNAIDEGPDVQLEEPGLVAKATTSTTGTSQKSRTESRMERKLRRQEAGVYRPKAEQRLEEQTDLDGTDSVLERIESLEGPPIETRQPKDKKPRHRPEGKRTVKERLEAKKTDREKQKEIAFAKRKPVGQELWGIQKSALVKKFGEEGWQPRKRLSPDTISGIRALHSSDSAAYSTEMLAGHFKITPEAIRRILKSKWRPNEEEAEDRRLRWERRGVKKWEEMAKDGVRPPKKWRTLGVKFEKKRAGGSGKKTKRDEGLVEEDVEDSSIGDVLDGRII